MRLSFEILIRRRNLVLGIALLFTLFGSLVVSLQRNYFITSAYLIPQGRYDEFATRIQAINQTQIMARVAQDLHVLQWPEFNDLEPDDDSVVHRLIHQIAIERNPVSSQRDLHFRAINHMLDHFVLLPDPLRKRVEIQYIALYPGRGRSIATNIAFSYQDALKNYPVQLVKAKQSSLSLNPHDGEILAVFIALGLLAGIFAAGLSEEFQTKRNQSFA